MKTLRIYVKPEQLNAIIAEIERLKIESYEYWGTSITLNNYITFSRSGNRYEVAFIIDNEIKVLSLKIKDIKQFIA